MLDTRKSVRLAILLEMLEEVSRATEPEEAVQAYARRIGKLRPVDAVLAVSVRNMPDGEYKITRKVFADQSGEPRHQLVDPWKNWKALAAQRGGFIGELISTPEPRLIYDLFLKNDPVLGEALAEMGACMAIPVFDSGKVLNWTLQFRRDPAGFTEQELEQNVLTGNLFGAMTKNLVSLDQIQKLNDRLRQQFEEVARVQQSLLPQSLPDVRGLRVATSYLTSEQAGGDYYDFFQMPGGRLGIIVADVSGHGPGAATVMAMLHAMVHAYPGDRNGGGPADVMRFANRQLVRAGMNGSFATAFVGLFDPRTRDLCYSCAGHPPTRVREKGRVGSLEGDSTLPLGITEDMEIPENCVTLRSGQTLVFYTDGITEAFGPTGVVRADGRTAVGGARDMFGIAGLDAAIAQAADDAEADAIIEAIHAAVFEHTGLRTRDDDQTLVVVKVVEEE